MVGMSSFVVPGGLQLVGLEKPTEPFTPSPQLSSAPVVPGPSWKGLSAETVVPPAFLLRSFGWSQTWRSLEELRNQKRLRQHLASQGLPALIPITWVLQETSQPSGISQMFTFEESLSLSLNIVGIHLVGSPWGPWES